MTIQALLRHRRSRRPAFLEIVLVVRLIHGTDIIVSLDRAREHGQGLAIGQALHLFTDRGADYAKPVGQTRLILRQASGLDILSVAMKFPSASP